MKFFDLFGRDHEVEMLKVEVLTSALNPEPPEVEVFPLRNIPVGYESDEERIHDGVNPCGRYGCPCMTYGYGVPSLE